MSDNTKSFGVVEGVVQFEPKRERVVNAQTVCDVTIKATNIKDPTTGEQRLVSVTIWPEFAAVYAGVKKGDALIVDGEYRVTTGQASDGSPREYLNWNATAIAWISAEVRAPRQVVQAPVAAAQVFAAAPVAVAQPVQAVAATPIVAPVAPVAPAQPVAVPTASPF